MKKHICREWESNPRSLDYMSGVLTTALSRQPCCKQSNQRGDLLAAGLPGGAGRSQYYTNIILVLYTKLIVWCEGEERSIPLQVERKHSKHTRQRSAVATLSFTSVGDLQATGSSNLLQAHINKGGI